MRILSKPALVLAVALTGLIFHHAARASTWTNVAGGSWSTPGNWTPGIPNAVDSVADFSTLDITADALVSLDGNRTVGTLLFGDLAPSNNWIINAGAPANSTLTLDVSGNSPIVNVANPTAVPIPSVNSVNFFPSVAQTATMNVVLAGNDGLTKTGAGTLILGRQNTYTGTTAVRFGALNLDFSAAGAPASNILSGASSLRLGGGTGGPGAGVLNVIGAVGATNSQSVTDTTIDLGSNVINVNQNGATTANVALGTLSRANHGVVNFLLPTSGSISAANGSIPNVWGNLGAWATVGTGAATNLAANDGTGKIISYVYAPGQDVTGAPTFASNPTASIRWSGSTGNATVSAGGTTDLNNLVFPDSLVRTLTIPSGTTLRMGASGGIFKTDPTKDQNGSVLTVGAAGSFLTAGGAPNTAGELVLYGNSTTPDQDAIRVSSAVTNNGTGVVTLVKTGNATARLDTAATYSGGSYVMSGRLRANAVGALGSGDIYVATGAQLYLNAAGQYNNNIFLSGKGFYEGGSATGGFFTGGAVRLAANNVEITGAVTLLGDTRIGARGATGTGAIISGKITGGFNLEFNGTAQDNSVLNLTNSASDWTGNTTLHLGAVRVGGAGEVIPNGPGKGNVIIQGDTINAFRSILDLNGKTETINGLSSAGELSRVFVRSNAGGAATLRMGDNDANGSYGGVIENGNAAAVVGITKIGAGTQTLSGANTYSGPTNVQNGTLRLGSDGALPTGTLLTLGSGATSGVLDLGGFNPTVASLSTSGTGVANLIGNSSTGAPSLLTVTGGTNVFAGTIQNTLPGGNQTVALTLSGGSLALSGANTYTGATNVNTGATLSVTGALASAGDLHVNGGATLTGAGDGVATGKVGNVFLESGASLRPGASAADGSIGTLTMSNLTVNGGDLRMDIPSPGTMDRVAVTGSANFAGPSTITPTGLIAGGSLTQTATLLTAAGSLTGTSPTLSVPPVTRPTFTLNFDTVQKRIVLTIDGAPKTLTWTGANSAAWDLNTTANWADGATAEKFFNLDSVLFTDQATTKNVTLNATVVPILVSVNNSAGNDYTISGAGGIGDTGFTGGTSLVKSGAGKLVLSTTNTYAGVTAVQNGTLQLGSNSALPAAAGLVLGSGATSGVLDLAGFSPTVASLSTSGTGVGNVIGNSSAATPSTLTVGAAAGSAASGIFGGVIQDTLPGGTQTTSLTVGGGTLILTGTNTYTGATTINSGATLQIGNGGTTGALGATAVNNQGTLAFNRSDTVAVSAAISGAGAFQKLGAGTVVLTSDNNFQGGVTIGAGTLQVGDGGVTGTIGDVPVSIAAGATLAFNRSADLAFFGAIGGAGEVKKSGAGFLALSSANTYSGPTTINAGTVIVNNNASLGQLPGGAVTIAPGGALDLSGNNTANQLNFGGKEFRIAGTGVNGTGALTNSGAISQNAAFTNVVLTGNATVGGSGRFDIRNGVGILNLGGFTLTKVGSAQFGLVGVNVSDGNIIVNEGIFAMETTTSLLDNGTGTKLTLNAPASGTTSLQFFNTVGTNITRPMVFNGDGIQIGNASGAAQPSAFGSPMLLNGNVIFTNLNNSAGALTVNGNISETGGPRSITKQGPTLLTLAGTNTYSGATGVTGGTLRVTGSIAASSGVTVENAASFEAAASQTVKRLTINNGGIGTVSAGVLKIGDNTGIPLTVDGTNGNTAKLDLTSRGAIIDFGLLPGPPILTNYRNQIIAGYNAGTWTGNGITSSIAAADPGGHGVGYAYASEVGLGGPGSTFMGTSVDGSAVVMRYTILGDASLDGKVDFTDLVALAQNYGSDFTTQPGIEGWWNRGDFNYDGKVDFTDLVKLAQGYGAALPSEPVPGAPIGFQQDLASGFAQVPEPAAATATLALLALGMSRRRSR